MWLDNIQEFFDSFCRFLGALLGIGIVYLAPQFIMDEEEDDKKNKIETKDKSTLTIINQVINENDQFITATCCNSKQSDEREKGEANDKSTHLISDQISNGTDHFITVSCCCSKSSDEKEKEAETSNGIDQIITSCRCCSNQNDEKEKAIRTGNKSTHTVGDEDNSRNGKDNHKSVQVNDDNEQVNNCNTRVDIRTEQILNERVNSSNMQVNDKTNQVINGNKQVVNGNEQMDNENEQVYSDSSTTVADSNVDESVNRDYVQVNVRTDQVNNMNEQVVNGNEQVVNEVSESQIIKQAFETVYKEVSKEWDSDEWKINVPKKVLAISTESESYHDVPSHVSSACNQSITVYSTSEVVDTDEDITEYKTLLNVKSSVSPSKKYKTTRKIYRGIRYSSSLKNKDRNQHLQRQSTFLDSRKKTVIETPENTFEELKESNVDAECSKTVNNDGNIVFRFKRSKSPLRRIFQTVLNTLHLKKVTNSKVTFPNSKNNQDTNNNNCHNNIEKNDDNNNSIAGIVKL